MDGRRSEGNRFVWITGAVILLVILLLSFSRAIATFYTDLLWFRDLGHTTVFWTTLWSRIVVFLIFAVVFFALAYSNVRIARSVAPRNLVSVTPEIPQELEEAIRRLRARIDPFVEWLLLGGAIVLAIMFGSAMADRWPTFQLALHAVPFGQADPQFGRDIGFFVFTLPALRAIIDWTLAALVVVLLATAVVHFIDGAIRPGARLQGFAPHVKAHLSVLAGLIVLVKAADYWLRIYELDFSTRGQVFGASYTDVHAQLPAYYILIAIALLAGIALLVNIRFRGWRLPAIALGVWIGASILIGGVYPSLVQQFRVTPNELAAETPYIKRNIAFTRKAFDLEGVFPRPFAATESLTGAQLRQDSQTIDNARLWDPAFVADAYRQLQEIRSYYVFNDIDVDRYVIRGQRQEVLLSARELDVNRLPDVSKTWVNQHLFYTHGYGAVVSPVREATAQGRPKFLVQNIPPEGDGTLGIHVPGIYFGEVTNDYVVVDTGLAEFDYPRGADNARTSYGGKGGVEVGGLLRRIAFSLRFQTSQLLLSSYVKPDSKVLFQRDLKTRIGELAPWLSLDRDPYITIINGRLVWIVDGYTSSNDYPYSQPQGGINYIRNSVKVTVDAYDGTVRMYAMDQKDPVLAAWRKVFPDLVLDGSRMPASVRPHLRYPEGLFRVQAEVYKVYHMSDPEVFYNKEDQWALPGEAAGTAMNPYYVLMRLPGADREDFVLMEPFTPRNRDNMIGWMAAKSDPADYGQRLVFQFPKQKLVLGPDQVVAAINQDPTISAQLTLWRQGGSRAELGNMLVLPIDQSVLYVQPLYLLAESVPIPQLTRVVVAFGDQVAMEPDLATALLRVFGAKAQGVVTPERAGAAPGTVPTTSTAPPAPSGSVAAQLRQAGDLYNRALEAQRRGDWATYGRLIGQLGQVLRQAAAASSEATRGR